MSKHFIIISCAVLLFILHINSYAAEPVEEERKSSVVITSKTLTADSKTNTAIFEGSVIARTEEVTMHSDRMTVYYDNREGRIMKIHAVGNVKVHNEEKAIFSDEAVYLDSEGKIIFSGNPKAVEGKNLITGTEITFYIKDNRAVVEGSRVILQNKKGLN